MAEPTTVNLVILVPNRYTVEYRVLEGKARCNIVSPYRQQASFTIRLVLLLLKRFRFPYERSWWFPESIYVY
jgi:hypothetical protein